MSLNMFWITAFIVKCLVLVLFCFILDLVYFVARANFRNINRVEFLLLVIIFVLSLIILCSAII